jgi:hypothetical protein
MEENLTILLACIKALCSVLKIKELPNAARAVSGGGRGSGLIG